MNVAKELALNTESFLTKVNPAYTSYIGKTKYANSMKLNSHTAASFVIARRGLGFKDVA